MSDNYNPYSAPETPSGPSTDSAAEERGYTTRMLHELSETKPWVRFISVLGFIGAGFMVLASCGGIFMAGQVAGGAGAGILLMFVYLVLAAVYFYISFLLSKYASSINSLIATGRKENLEEALTHQKQFWKASGILTIVFIGLTILAIFVALVVGVRNFSGFGKY